MNVANMLKPGWLTTNVAGAQKARVGNYIGKSAAQIVLADDVKALLLSMPFVGSKSILDSIIITSTFILQGGRAESAKRWRRRTLSSLGGRGLRCASGSSSWASSSQSSKPRTRPPRMSKKPSKRSGTQRCARQTSRGSYEEPRVRSRTTLGGRRDLRVTSYAVTQSEMWEPFEKSVRILVRFNLSSFFLMPSI